MERRSSASRKTAHRRRRAPERPPWSRFNDGVVIGVTAHSAAIAYATVRWGPEFTCSPLLVLLGAAQIFYMLPLALLLAASARVEALIGLLTVAGLTVLPLALIAGTGGFRVMPFL